MRNHFNYLPTALLGHFFHAFSPSADFFLNQLFRKILLGIPSECHSLKLDQVWYAGLIWVQTVCKGYQQMTLVGKELTCAMHVNIEMTM